MPRNFEVAESGSGHVLCNGCLVSQRVADM